MGDLFNSKFIKDLQDGKLPPVQVGLDDSSLAKVFLVATGIIVTFFIIRKFMK